MNGDGRSRGDDAEWRVRVAAVRELARPGDLHVDAIGTALADPHPAVRRAAARALGTTGSVRSFDVLRAAASDGDKNVRSESAWALRTLLEQRPELATRVVDALSDPVWRVRFWAVRAQLLHRPDPALTLLAPALEDEVASVRWAATQSIGAVPASGWPGRWSDPERAGCLLTRACDPATVRLEAIRSLHWTDDERVVAAYATACDDEDGRVREAAAHGLRDRPDAAAVEPLRRVLRDGMLWARVSAAAALGRIGGPVAFDALEEALRDRRRRVRRTAAAALASLGDERAIPVLAALVRRSSDLDVLSGAAYGLGCLGGPAARAALRELRRRRDLDRRVRQLIDDALARSGPRSRRWLRGRWPVSGRRSG